MNLKAKGPTRGQSRNRAAGRSTRWRNLNLAYRQITFSLLLSFPARVTSVYIKSKHTMTLRVTRYDGKSSYTARSPRCAKRTSEMPNPYRGGTFTSL